MSLPSTSALPKNFLDQACLRETLKDKEYVHTRENLQAAMRMPAEHRWVADWLFLDSNTCFHRNILLPPEAFSSCLAVKVAQGLNPSTDDAPFALPPDFYELSPLMRLIYYPQVSDVLFIPVAAIANILVGYAIVIKIGTIPGGEAHTSFFCRFAFDTVSGDLTMILNLAAVDGAADGATMVMGMGIDHDGTKRHRVFTCPLSEYSFECIPNRVLPKDYGVEKNSNSQPAETDGSETLSSEYTGVQLSDEDVALGQWKTPSDNYSASQADNMQNSVNGFKKPCAQSPVGQEPKIQIVETEEPRRRQKSQRPWILRENGSTADGVGIPRRPGTSSTAAGAFDMECLKRCLDVLEQALSGDLFALDVKDDVRTSSPKQVDISLQMGKADLMTASNLKDRIIQSYYSTNLSIPRDIRFNATVAPWAFAHSQRRTENQRAVPLAPRSKSVDWKKTEDGVQLELKALADRKEAQRRRNRLSAARSYERRKRRKEMEEKRRLAALKQ